MKAGSSPLRIARVRSVEEGSNGPIRSLKLEYKSRPSKSYTVVTHAPEQVTVVTKVEKIENYANAELPASSAENSAPSRPTSWTSSSGRLRLQCTGEPKWLLSQVSRG